MLVWDFNDTFSHRARDLNSTLQPQLLKKILFSRLWRGWRARHLDSILTSQLFKKNVSFSQGLEADGEPASQRSAPPLRVHAGGDVREPARRGLPVSRPRAEPYASQQPRPPSQRAEPVRGPHPASISRWCAPLEKVHIKGDAIHIRFFYITQTKYLR